MAYYSESQDQAIIKTIYTSMQDLEVEVVYEPDAIPYVGNGKGSQLLWSILEDNLNKVFSVRKQDVNVIVPKTLDKMKPIPVQNKKEWTAQEIHTLSASHCSSNTDKKIHFCTIFLSGHFKESDQVKETTIAVSLNGTTVIAIFKDVIYSMSDASAPKLLKKFLGPFAEQATLVHEMGHALGAVDNGVKMHADHHDSSHPKHSTDQKCVMFWKIEVVDDLKVFIRNLITSGSDILWGEYTLKDFENYKP